GALRRPSEARRVASMEADNVCGSVAESGSPEHPFRGTTRTRFKLTLQRRSERSVATLLVGRGRDLC
ncbi:hypothetical protein ACFL5O_11860, partial [Myxococcota bacterium]